METSSKPYESPDDLTGVPGRGEPHDLATLAAVLYGEEELGEHVDKHDEWLAATGDWTPSEIRSVLYEEASDSALT
jgi:hypothetical protein